ncbi:Fra10ac1 [Scenedesmus sp. PABB004]|nr:Fra10ac1 [Scenedesmus sp. PABB004]
MAEQQHASPPPPPPTQQQQQQQQQQPAAAAAGGGALPPFLAAQGAATAAAASAALREHAAACLARHFAGDAPLGRGPVAQAELESPAGPVKAAAEHPLLAFLATPRLPPELAHQYYRDNLAGLTAHERHRRLLSELPGGGARRATARPRPRRAAPPARRAAPRRAHPAAAPRAAAGAAGGAADPAAALAATVSDEDALRAHHRFLRGPADEAGEDARAWGARLARRYYARLFKEYAIADLSRHAEGRIGLRWRTVAEVRSGKGQFVCGARGCAAVGGLSAFEVNFAYAEAGQAKQALVKVRLCADCAAKLNHGRGGAAYRPVAEGARGGGAASSSGSDGERRRRRRRRDGGGSGGKDRKRRRRGGASDGSGSSSSSSSSSSDEEGGREGGRAAGGAAASRGGGGAAAAARPSAS